MAKVHVSNVVVLNNPATFYSSFQFEITFECIEELKEGKPKSINITKVIGRFDIIPTDVLWYDE